MGVNKKCILHSQRTHCTLQTKQKNNEVTSKLLLFVLFCFCFCSCGGFEAGCYAWHSCTTDNCRFPLPSHHQSSLKQLQHVLFFLFFFWDWPSHCFCSARQLNKMDIPKRLVLVIVLAETHWPDKGRTFVSEVNLKTKRAMSISSEVTSSWDGESAIEVGAVSSPLLSWLDVSSVIGVIALASRLGTELFWNSATHWFF